MKKIIFTFLISFTFLNADSYDNLYTCIAYQKNHGSKAQKLNMNESIAKGGWFSLSVKVNFMRAIVSKGEDKINNIKYDDMRFAYRQTVIGYNLYVYKYNKDYFLIEEDNKIKPRFSITVDNGDTLYHMCSRYKNNNSKDMTE